MKAKGKIGLLLTGGGARGAYQAGALAAILEICHKTQIEFPFHTISGISAGGINACLLASHIEDNNLLKAAQKLHETWVNITSSDVFIADTFSLTTNGLKWVTALSMGRIRASDKSLSLLDTRPLRQLLRKHIQPSAITANINTGIFNALSLTAISYSSGISRTFFQGRADLQGWSRIKREGVRADITYDHIMASSAIPLLFPTIKVGNEHYGDGSLRDYTPLTSPIKLGCDKILIIGVRKRFQSLPAMHSTPTLARIFSIILNGILLDGLDTDLERLERINTTLDLLKKPELSPLNKVETFVMAPSQVLSTVAAKEADSMPKGIRYLLNGLGKKNDAADLISYILFESNYTKKLFELGHSDILEQQDSLLKFLTT